MTQKIRFHLDENVNGAIADGLRRHSIDVTTTADVNLIAATDELQLQFALTHRRIIFTQDTDFLKLHNAGVEHCGIVFCIKDSRSIGEILRGLILIWEVLGTEEIAGKVEFL